MRLPRVRLTARPLMIAVAIVAVVLAMVRAADGLYRDLITWRLE